MICLLNSSLAVFPLELEYLSWPALLLLVGIGSAYFVLLGMWSLAGVPAVRKWVTISLRLIVVIVLGLIIGGARWKEVSKDLEVVVIRDVSPSVANVSNYPGETVQSSIDKYITDSASRGKPADDMFGQISFDQSAMIDVLPSINPSINSGSIRRTSTGTDIANAIQLGLATFAKGEMRRLVLITDGNATQGDTDAAITAAAAQNVPIDVMPLHYNIQHEVLMDKIVAPAWRRENEPFTLDIYLKSTNDTPVTGKLTVSDHDTPIDLDPATPGVQPTREVTLPPGTPEHPSVKVEHVRIPAQQSPGVHQFHAYFDPDKAGTNVAVATGSTGAAGSAGAAAANTVDTLGSNNGGDAFTYVKGKGRILYIDDAPNGSGSILANALNEEGISIAPADHVTSGEFPSSLIELQNFDAVILANVRYGSGGLSDQQQRNLATYVHDMGGGLVMIGGPDTFGAGGWQGRQLEEVLPVSMDIPAIRQIPKGALVLAMDPAEAQEGTYLGMQSAIKACEALSAQDDVGIISYGMGGCTWDLPLGPKGDGSKAIAAAKHMSLGDLPSFEDAINLAMTGDGSSKGLLADDAASKHIIVITDDDPQMPSPETIARLRAAKISVSTITVYPHQPHNIAPGTLELAKLTGGRSFGPIEDDASRKTIPQIFVKEATVVRRSLISENPKGIPLTRRPSTSDMVKGLGQSLPMVHGLVLTSRKSNPQIQLPITAGSHNDPLLASWQTGLGRVAVYTSDATNKWGVEWVGSSNYNKLWAQIVRGVARPPMSDKFEVSITQQNDKGHIVVEGSDKDSGFMNFLNLHANVVSPDPDKPAINPHMVQTGPGRYEGDFDLTDAGTYVAVTQYSDQDGNVGNLPVAGLSMNSSAELRDLQSNDSLLNDIAYRTHGRQLPPFDSEHADLFDHNDLPPTVSTLPIWNQLIPILLGLILLDIAARRIAWDWTALKKYAATSAGMVRSFTATRKVETRASLDALQRVRDETGATKKTLSSQKSDAPARPNPSAKFEAKGVTGDITNIVGGATDKPIPPPPKKIDPKGGGPSGGMSNLLEAKRRAQQMIKEKESGDN